MDLGELPTGVESPFIPILIWTVLGVVAVAGLLGTLVAARRNSRRRIVLLIGASMLLIALATGLAIRHRLDLAAVIDGDVCPWYPAGIHYEGEYVMVFLPDGEDPFAQYRNCLRLQYQVAVSLLVGCTLLTLTGVIVQRCLVRPPAAAGFTEIVQQD